MEGFKTVWEIFQTGGPAAILACMWYLERRERQAANAAKDLLTERVITAMQEVNTAMAAIKDVVTRRGR